MPKKRGYTVAKKLILDGTATNVSQLLEVMDITPLSKDIHVGPTRLKNLFANPALFELSDIYAMAAAIGVDETALLMLVHHEAIAKRKKRK